ncbi:MAG: IS3 family transposase [Bacteroidetes bacterium]|nr:IS3 family transposase [Bacteroidota bacterium]
MKESHAQVGFGPLCMLFGKTRYAFYKKGKNQQRWLNEEQIVLEMVSIIRRELPCTGTPKLYHMLRKTLQDHHIKMGRDSLHRLLCGNGLTIRPRKRYVVTTDSRHWMKKYPNLIKDLVINESEQVWVSDITYIQVGEAFNFLSLITDAYSKQIMGFCLHPTLEAEGCMNALKMALSQKIKYDISHIHHSDRGAQYCCGDYVDLLHTAGLGISMTENGDPYQNAIAERVNGILKYEFSLNREFADTTQALEVIQKSIRAYNELSPHMSCNYLTPVQAHQMKGVLEKKWKPKVKQKEKEVLFDSV